MTSWWNKSIRQAFIRHGKRRATSRRPLGLEALEARCTPTLFTNPTPIQIPTGLTGAGPADPYPSIINVSVPSGEIITDVNVILNSLSHTLPPDVDVLVVAPDGTNVLVMSDNGNSGGATNATLTFDQQAANELGDVPVVTGSYRPLNVNGGDPDTIPGAPANPRQFSLAAFTGLDPNGNWQIRIHDDGAGDSGVLAGGWSLDITSRTNSTPVANGDSYTTNEDTPLTINAPGVLGNDTDGDGDPLTAALVTGPTNGSLTFNANGSFTYTPRANFNGNDSFTYRASDGIASSGTATVMIAVTSVNDTPEACDDKYLTQVDRALFRDAESGVLANDLDPDGAVRRTLMAENFDALPLGPFSEESGGDGTDWTNVPPVGWSIDNRRNLGGINNGVPGIDNPSSNNGVFDWAGWTFADKQSWVTVAGDQNRNEFVKGQNVVAIADPDEWDDQPHPTPGTYNTFLRTRPISLAGILPNTLSLTFDSSWRPEGFDDGSANNQNNQTALVRVSYDGGTTFGEVLHWDSDPNGAFFKPDATNETVVLALNNPTHAANIVIEFGLTLAANDWWWAIDNLTVAGDRTLQESLTANLVAGPSNGSVTLNADGSFLYTPNAGFVGTDSFTYQANDGVVNSNVATVTLEVRTNTRPPVANDDAYSVSQNQTLTVNATPGVLGNDTDPDVDGGNGGLTAVLVSGPSHGSLTLNPFGSFVYTPTTDYFGPDSFTYRATDGVATSGVATVQINVIERNTNAPVAANDSYTTNEDTPLTVNAPGVLANDTDADGNVLTAALVAGPKNGTLTLNANGSFTYTPRANYNGTDSFTYKARDFRFESAVATVAITITSINDTPIAVDDIYTTPIDTPLTVNAPGVLLNDVDDGEFTTLLSENFEGLPLAPFVSPGESGGDGTDWTSTLPTGWTRDNSSTPAGGPVEFFGWNAFDIDSWVATAGNQDRNRFTLGGSGMHGNVMVADPDEYDDLVDIDPDGYNVFFSTPNISLANIQPNTATIEFDSSFRPFDGMTGTVQVTFDGGATYTTLLTLTGANSGGNSSLSRTNEHLIVNVPNPGSGSMSFRFGLTNAGNDWWWAVDNVAVQAQRIVGPGLSVSTVSGPNRGSLTLNANGSFTYTPNAGIRGVDTFVYRATDGTLTDDALVTIGVDNRTPIATDDAYSVNEDQVLTINAPGVLGNDNDPDGDPLSALLATGPANGTLTLNANGSFTYTPKANFHGIDTFAYRNNDGLATSAAAVVTITVTPVDDTPVAVDDSYTTDAGVPLNVAASGLLKNDNSGGPFTLTLLKETFEGFTLRPFQSASTLNDGDGTDWTDALPSGWVRDNTDTPSGDPVEFFGWNILDIDSWISTQGNQDRVRFTRGGAGMHGTVLVADADAYDDQTNVDPNLFNVFVRTPALPLANILPGTVTLDFDSSFFPENNQTAVLDASYDGGTTWSRLLTFDTANSGGNSSFTRINDHYSLNLDNPSTGTLTIRYGLTNAGNNWWWALDNIEIKGTRDDGDPLMAMKVADPANGTVVVNANGSFTYTPNAGFAGVDSFTYKVNDGFRDSNVATVSISVVGRPSAVNDTYATDEDQPLTVNAPGVLGNDTDPNGDPLTAVKVTDPANGSLTLNANGSFTYTPRANFNGTDSFTYKANDGTFDSNTATVTITVRAVNDTPVALDNAYSVNEDDVLTVPAPGVLGNDYDVENAAVATLFSETFESLTLRAFQSATESGGDGTDWTDALPAGWVRDNTTTPAGNPVEFFGWNAMDVDSWVATEGNQDRGTFALGGVGAHGTVLVADPDAYDDGTDIDPNLFNVLLRTPAISLNGVVPNTVVLEFDSSFRPEGTQTGKVEVSFDGGTTWTTLLTLNNDSVPGGSGSLSRANEHVALNVANPSGGNALFRFGLTEAGNNWWWAVDNVRVTALKTDPATLTARLVTGPTRGTLVLNANGSFVYTPNIATSGTDSFTYRANDGTVDGNIATVTITVNAVGPLQVTTLTPTPTGFHVQFNKKFNPTVLNLFDIQSGVFGAADVVLTGDSVGDVFGTLVTAEDNESLRFIKTGGLLDPDTYRITLRSTANGFKDGAGTLLDGNNDGTTGDNYAGTFVVASSSARIIRLPDFSRGPNQPVNVPADASGLPLMIDNGAGVESVFVDLRYNPALLTITDAVLGPDAPAGSSLVSNLTTPGVATISFITPTPLAVGARHFVTLRANVPSTATYRSKEVLRFAEVRANGGSLAVVGDDAVHVAAYFGNTTGSGDVYDPLDAQRVQRVEVGLDSGFAAFPVADPVVVADITRDDFLDGLDAARILQESVGIDRPEIPDLPDPLPPVNPDPGPDPAVTLRTDYSGLPGNTVSVSVDFARLATEAGVDFDIVSTALRVRYDTTKLTLNVADILPGTITRPADGWTFASNIVANVAANTNEVRVSAFRATGVNPDLGTLAVFNFTINAGATGTAALNLQATGTNVRNNLGQNLILNPAPSNGADAADGLVTIGAGNQPPVADNQEVSLDEDVATPITLTGSDAEGAPLRFIVVTAPANGTLSGTAPNLTYTPNGNYNGPDSFTFKVNDGVQDGNTATVSITVRPVNDAPVATDGSAATNEDTPTSGQLTASDVDGDALTFTTVGNPLNGTVVVNANGSYTYTPAANFNGTDRFTFKARDGAAESNVATVTVTVQPVNDAPVSADDTYGTVRGRTLNVPASGVLGNDTDDIFPVTLYREDFEGFPLQPFQSPTEVGRGDGTDWTEALPAGWVRDQTTTPVGNPAEFFGWHLMDIDSWIATEGNQARNTFTRGGVGAHGTIAVADGDAFDDGTNVDPLSFNVLLTTPAIPLAGALAGTYSLDFDSSFRPENNQTGRVEVSYDGGATWAMFFELTTANSGGNDSLTRANEHVSLGLVPTAEATTAMFRFGYTAGNNWWWAIDNVALTGMNRDPGSGVLTAQKVVDPVNGTVTLNPDGSFTYTPNAGFIGMDTFTYRPNDGTQDGNVATVTINVAELNDVAPVAHDDSYAIDEDMTLTVSAPGVLGNDNDADGNPLTAVKVSDPANGTLTFNADGSFTYVPQANFSGSDSFTYKARDFLFDSNVATVTIEVRPINDVPVANDDRYRSAEDTSLTVNAATGVLANDTDADGTTRVTLLEENFEGLPLRPFESATEAGGDGTDWTDIPPAGWVRDNTTTPAGSPQEFFGWTFLDVDSWVATEGDQARSLFTRGGIGARGTVAVADPDAYDDGTDVGPDLFNVFLITPLLNGDGFVPNTIVLEFDSSFRPEGTQTGRAEVSFDGGATWTTLLTLNNDTVPGGEGSVTRTNEHVVLNVANSGAGQMVFRFGMTMAGNNWWWAIDNVRVTGDKTDQASLRAALLTSPSNGTAVLNADGSFTYTPAANFNGTDSFTYRVNDGTVDGNVATVHLVVTEVNDAPTAGDDARRAGKDTPLTFAANTLLANDSTGPANESGQTLGVVSVQDAVNGTVELTNGKITFTPTPGFTGEARFNYTIQDDGATNGVADPMQATGLVTVTVVAPRQVESVVIDNGLVQRSMVRSLTVTFNGLVTLQPGAFELLKQGGAAVSLNVSTTTQNGKTVARITFTGSDVIGRSLADGNYTLTVVAANILDEFGRALDGDRDGNAGGNRQDAFHRLFGDGTGDGAVTQEDITMFFTTFRKVRGSSGFLDYFDYDGDGDVDYVDYFQLQRRRGS